MSSIGFIGLGNIGLPMAESVVRGGFAVTGYDRREEVLERFVRNGGKAGRSAADVAAAAQIIGVCVMNDAQLRSVVLDAEGVLEGARPGTIVVVHSTILPSTIHDLGAVLAARDVHLVDAQISGGDLRAAEGTLGIMVGGSKEDFGKCLPYLETMGAAVRHMGPLGAGAATKLALQGMTFINQLAALEVARFAGLHNISEPALMEMAEATTAQSFMTRNWGHFDRQLFIHTLADREDLYRFYDKDLMYLAQAAREENLSMPLTALAQQLLGPSFKNRKAELEERGVSY